MDTWRLFKPVIRKHDDTYREVLQKGWGNGYVYIHKESFCFNMKSEQYYELCGRLHLDAGEEITWEGRALNLVSESELGDWRSLGFDTLHGYNNPKHDMEYVLKWTMHMLSNLIRIENALRSGLISLQPD